MLLHENDDFTLVRDGRFVRAALKRPHRVLSNCYVNGGLRQNLTHICNHQCSEGSGHADRHALIASLGPSAYHARACEEAGTPAATSVLLSTAANMQCTVLAEAAHEELEVRVAATAGVLGNATRAGDPAGWHETAQGNRKIQPENGKQPPTRLHTEAGLDHQDKSLGGTIVTMAFVNRPCTPACLVRAATMVSEGKSVAILDLRMPSLQSPGLATGTGTDQIAVAAPLARDSEDWERHWAGGHNSLGELLGRATRDAVRRCLLLQNGICAELRRTLCGALGRHGCDEPALRRCARDELNAEQAELFERNLLGVIHDPQSAAAAYCLGECIDLATAGILHQEAAREAILNQAALLAASVAVQPDRFAEFRRELQTRPGRDPGSLATLAVIRGFSAKMELIPHIALVLSACLADGLFGDPVYRLHPIRQLGAWSLKWEKILFARGLNGYLGGIIHLVLVVGAALFAWWAVHWLLALWNPWASLAWDAFIAYSLLCLRDLLAHGRRVLNSLNDLREARRQVSMLVGRDTEQLDRGGVVRATIESLAENLTDGVLTPLWALCLFGLPGIILVKAVSSLDSMVGYKNERYRRFGWAAARSDDLVHWLPARLSVLLIALSAALLRLHPRLALRTARRWHGMLASPNSGWSEAACAGALRVRLIGPISYQGRLVNEAFMGDEDWPADLEARHLEQALRLILACSLLALVFGLVLTVLPQALSAAMPNRWLASG